MSSVRRTSVEERNLKVLHTGQLALQSEHEIHQATPVQTERLLHLSRTLQSSLDVGKVIDLFHTEINSLVLLDGFYYLHPTEEIEIMHGEPGRHSAKYRLVIEEEELGEVCFIKNTRFSKQHIKNLENLLCSLVYPLRNALLYRKAVQNAYKDPLTGICNRAAMNEASYREVELAQRYGSPLSMIVLDIDYFKHINDTYGHATGDCLLKALADCTISCIRSSDMLFRYGGEEFVVLLPNTFSTGAMFVAERIRRNVERHECNCNGHSIKITVSAGVADLGPGENEHKLFAKTDRALYKAKSAGRNRVMIAK